MTDSAKYAEVHSYFSQLIEQYGPTPKGADYNGEESQHIRYNQLSKLFTRKEYSLLDYGSSYGAFAEFILPTGECTQYCGYDIIAEVVEAANASFAGDSRVSFISELAPEEKYDYVIASGTYNYKGTKSHEEWTSNVLAELETMNRLGVYGFASNFLTKYSDHEKMKDHLYYPDPCELFDYRKRRFSRNVAILHDYELYDFTLIVRK